MRRDYTTLVTCVTALVMAFALLAPDDASAQRVGLDTHLRFEQPVRIPDATLPAGSYVFRLDENRQFVWIVSDNTGTTFGPYMTRPRHRNEAGDRIVILDRPLLERGAPTVRAWFGRHRNDGRELVYAANGRD